MRNGDFFLFFSALIPLNLAACGHSDASGAAIGAGGSSHSASGGVISASSTQTGGTRASGHGTGGTGEVAGSSTEPFDTSVAGGSSMDIALTGGKAATGGSSAVAASVVTGGANTAGMHTTGGTGTMDIKSSGGSAVAGGTQNTGGTSVAIPAAKPSAVDVLFMIDNSTSMADKQGVLATSLPSLLGRLAQPNCLDSAGKVVGQVRFDGTCNDGKAEFKPVRDLHIGVITSSLGDHGADSVCSPGRATSFSDINGNPILTPSDVNDASHLVGSLPRGSAMLTADPTVTQSAQVRVDPLGFLAWGDANQTPTASELTSAQHAFADMVQAAAERGCGFESQLESWFRFLVDPVPPIYPITKDGTGEAQRLGSDDALLAQRAAFLRPNSLVLVVMLTDENDCSLRDTDVGWVSADTHASITTGSPACSTNPNDPCCYSCTVSSPPNGCAVCPTTDIAPDDSAYQANLRCWQQKRRFGFDFLYPVSRYVIGLTKPELCPDQNFGDMDCDCSYAKSIGVSCSPGARRLPNPLYSNTVGVDNGGSSVPSKYQGQPRTDNSNVFLAGILGVPWQDIGYADQDGKLTYIPVTNPAWTAASTAPSTPAPNGIWSLIYGDEMVQPGDAHMIESLEPRPGLPGPSAAAGADPISGHEWNTAYQDLEYACIFPLPAPRPCQCDATAADSATCKYTNPNDCCTLVYSIDGRKVTKDGEYSKPVCEGNTQTSAKAYPGLREIAVLREYALGTSYASPTARGNSVVTSICPKQLTGDPANAGFGYNPATDAIVARLAERLSLE